MTGKYKTNLDNPPDELWYCWGDDYERFPVDGEGVLEGLSSDHPRFHVLVYEWKLEAVKGKPAKKASKESKEK